MEWVGMWSVWENIDPLDRHIINDDDHSAALPSSGKGRVSSQLDWRRVSVDQA